MPVFAVTTARGPRWDPGRGIREQSGWEAHGACMDSLVDQGIVILGGPIGADPGEPEAPREPRELALLAMEADSARHVRSAFAADPWIISGVIRILSIRPWTIWLSRGEADATRDGWVDRTQAGRGDAQ
jgi:hypothetical protein